MKKVIASLVLIGSILPASFAQQVKAKPQLSAFTRKYFNDMAHAADKTTPMPDYVYKSIGGKTYLSTFIKVNEHVDEAAIKALGVLTGTKAGNLWVVQVPVEQLTTFTQLNGISNIDLDIPVAPMLDQARKATKADSAQKGYSLPSPLTGHGVVVGIIDAGFDFNHPTLYDTLHSSYRVKRVWRQKVNGTPPSGYFYGNEITDPYMIRANGTDTAITTHGTHVAGIAAGSGYGSASNNRYRGMAYESDMAFVCIMPAPYQWAVPGTSDIVDGMDYLFTYSQSVFKPCIANLSWGSSIGPHDGHSFFSEFCNALTGPGKIFACSAGNSGGDTLHLEKTFSLTNNTVSTFVTFSEYLDTNNQRTWVDVWGDSSKPFCLNIRLFNGPTAVDSTGMICIADTAQSYALIGSDGDTCYVTVNMAYPEYNGKPHALLTLYSKTDDNVCLTATATSGTINMWEGYVLPPTGYYGEFKKLGYPWAVDGDTRMTTSDYSSSFSAISVGAYSSKTSFTNISGASLGYSAVLNKIAPFSSMGPTVGGRVKPDITGPGLALASAVSSYDTSYSPTGDNYNAVISKITLGGRDYRYAMAAGTSMSSPAVSGIIAMMLQLNPLLTPDSVKSIMRLTAIKDAHTGTIPAGGSNIWGAGKINAYGALKYMSQLTSVQNILDEEGLGCILYPNPSKGNFTLNYASKTNGVLSVEVYDITGRVIGTWSWPVAVGANTKSIALNNAPPGIYFTKIASAADKFKVISTVVE